MVTKLIREPSIVSRICGTGRCHPPEILTNAELASRFLLSHPQVTPEWIEQRTGVRERRIARRDHDADRNSALALAAARAALEMAHRTPADIDQIIYATCTPDTLIPSTASWLQAELGASNAWAFDLNGACAGFIYGLAVADHAIRAGAARLCLVIGADVLSAFTDWGDPRSCILFGDGAGAVLLEPAAPGASRRLVDVRPGSQGQHAKIFTIPSGGSRAPASRARETPHVFTMQMDGRAVRREAEAALTRMGYEALAAAGLAIDELDWLIPHQANLRIIEAVAHNLGIAMARVMVNIDSYGNTSAATIPTLLDEAVRSGRLTPGQNVLLAGFGAGVTHGTALLRW